MFVWDPSWFLLVGIWSSYYYLLAGCMFMMRTFRNYEYCIWIRKSEWRILEEFHIPVENTNMFGGHNVWPCTRTDRWRSIGLPFADSHILLICAGGCWFEKIDIEELWRILAILKHTVCWLCFYRWTRYTGIRRWVRNRKNKLYIIVRFFGKSWGIVVVDLRCNQLIFLEQPFQWGLKTDSSINLINYSTKKLPQQ